MKQRIIMLVVFVVFTNCFGFLLYGMDEKQVQGEKKWSVHVVTQSGSKQTSVGENLYSVSCDSEGAIVTVDLALWNRKWEKNLHDVIRTKDAVLAALRENNESLLENQTKLQKELELESCRSNRWQECYNQTCIELTRAFDDCWDLKRAKKAVEETLGCTRDELVIVQERAEQLFTANTGLEEQIQDLTKKFKAAQKENELQLQAAQKQLEENELVDAKLKAGLVRLQERSTPQNHNSVPSNRSLPRHPWPLYCASFVTGSITTAIVCCAVLRYTSLLSYLTQTA